MLPVVAVGWIIFRADTLTDAMLFVQALGNTGQEFLALPDTVLQILTPFNLLASAIGCLIFFMPRGYVVGASLSKTTGSIALMSARILYCAVVLPCALVLALSSDFSPFLYFRF